MQGDKKLFYHYSADAKCSSGSSGSIAHIPVGNRLRPLVKITFWRGVLNSYTFLTSSALLWLGVYMSIPACFITILATYGAYCQLKNTPPCVCQRADIFRHAPKKGAAQCYTLYPRCDSSQASAVVSSINTRLS